MIGPDDDTVPIDLPPAPPLRHPLVVFARLLGLALLSWSLVIAAAALACHACAPVTVTRDVTHR